ncbi:MAG: glycosyl hydrolase 115 family protein [Kiritimatiellae bacterium]|nr:glycosyl hydrolase 115 family protein [Kiritimatiellia bacterium]
MRLTTATILLVSALAANADGVKYRGIFVNDEDWSLRPWAVKHFGKKEQIGIRAYEEIFSLMKKDGLNLIWPAMHEGGYEFSSRPENLELARKHGIVVGTSHCEPMLRNNCYLPKEDKKKWSWVANRDFLVDYWKEGVRRGTGFSNRVERVDRVEDILWTIGMRGIHDGKMQDGKTTEEKIKILEEVFAAQCAMLPEGAPKLFVPYKEVLPIFNAGLKVPKDATIMWTNDNFGYVRRVGGPQCQGYGGGIYWHASYHGSPHGYIHLCTTPPAFMWYELVAKCWENGVRDVWMVNAGDVFQAEILLDAYGRFAADPEAWKTRGEAQSEVLRMWVDECFVQLDTHAEAQRGGGRRESCVWGNPPDPLGEAAPKKLCARSLSATLREKIVLHLAEYYNLGFNRRPEHMCVQWTTNLPATVKSSLLKRYHALLAEDVEIEAALGDWGRDRYFRLVGFQARFLAYAGIIHLEGRDKEYARSVIDPLYERWDKLDNGKWSGFWCDTIDERGGKRQPTAHNRWSSQMQWPWNEPADPYATKDRGVARVDYPATAYRADIPEPVWLDPVANTPANGGAWTRVEGLGTSGRALALLPVKPGVGKGASVEFSLTGFTRLTGLENHVNPVNPVEKETLVLQFLPDFALWPGLKLGVEVSFDVSPERSEVAEGEFNAGCGTAEYVAVPKSDANIGEHDPVRNRAVQDNFIRVEVPVPAGATSVKIIATDPGVVIDRIGVRVKPSTPSASLARPFNHLSRALPFADKIVYNAS